MTSRLHLQVLGSVIDVEVQSDALPRLKEQWARCLADADAPTDATLEAMTETDLHRHDYSLASAVTLRGILRAGGTRTLLHAAGLSDTSGRVAVLVAASGTGKTTAARTLGRTLGYVTDETVCFNDDLGLTAYPKPLSLVMRADEPHNKSQHSPDELGLRRAATDLRVGLFVVLDRFDADDHGYGAPPTLEPMGLLDAMIAIIPQSSALPSQPAPLRTLAAHLLACGGAQRLSYTEIGEAAGLIADALADSAPLDLPVDGYPPMDDEHYGQPAPEGTYARKQYVDAIGVDEELLVLVGMQPLRLSGIGATVWRAAESPVTREELVAICREVHGDHPDAPALVDQAVDAMVEHGLI